MEKTDSPLSKRVISRSNVRCSLPAQKSSEAFYPHRLILAEPSCNSNYKRVDDSVRGGNVYLQLFAQVVSEAAAVQIISASYKKARQKPGLIISEYYARLN